MDYARIQNFTNFNKKLFKFGLVGCTGLAIDFFITWAFSYIFNLNFIVSSGFGFVIATISNYNLNRRWTFRGIGQTNKSRFRAFFAVSLTGLILSSVLLNHLTKTLKIEEYLSKVLTVMVVFIWNFGANNFVTFKNRPKVIHPSDIV
ncbi:GtrA family protein [Pedobacter foliorum]|uniref:GtrA family protein n=1 Tax=Pedobacter foliorum TaxID=2739058 RepID=UPI001563E9F6|nr:GtrA family protein [Pedobacter foliorum]